MTQALLLSTLLVLTLGAGQKSKLAAAQNSFNRGDFDATLRLLTQAQAESTDDVTLADVFLLRGQAYGAMRNLPQAEDALAQALEHNPEATLDANRVDPALVTMLSGLKQRLRGSLEVDTPDKPGAKVTFDGKLLGTTPLRAQVEIGRHKLEARSPDGKLGASQETVVRARRLTRESLTLTDLPPEADPPDAPGGHEGLVLFGFGKPLADVRLQFDPFQWGEGAGIEIGGGLQNQYLRFSAHFRMFPEFGLTLRGAFHVPVADKLRAYVELELPVIFYGNATPPVAVGLGGAGGVDYAISRWFSPFAQIGARHYFLTPRDDNRLTLEAGVRLQLP